ncbi:hypothetical protein ACROYT_G008645 [Oculina patagonica]
MADDTPSLMEIDVPLTSNKSLETSSSSIRAPIEPIEAPIESVNTPIEPIKAPIEPVKAPKDSSKTADEAVSLDHGLFDPVAQPTSWKPSSSFSNFLESNFRRKLTYQQALVILEDWAIPEVNSLSAPKLDQQLLNQVPSKLKSFLVGSGGTPNFTGDQRVVAERGHREDPLFKRRLLQPPFSCTQKGWTYASGDRSKLSEQVHFKRAFPDGKSQLFENVAFKRRFYDKYRFKGRLPFSSRPPVISKVSSVYLGGHLLPVQRPPIRPVFSPQNFYKTNEANRSIPEEKVNTSHIYLDDFLLLAATKEEAVKNTHLLVTLLQSLGFIVNFKKSSLTPSQVITFLGFKIDSTSMMLSLPAEKIYKILDSAHRLLAPQRITLRNLASLIGLLESSRPAIWRAPLHFRHLQCDLIWGLQMNRESYDARITLSTSARGELTWWLENTRSTNGSPVHLPPPDMQITTLGRWLRTFISAAGIDSKIFKAPSVRSLYDSSRQCICSTVNYHVYG